MRNRFPLGELWEWPGYMPEGLLDGYRFYKHVPKDRDANLRFRLKLIQKANENQKLQDAVREMCRRDLLFWVNVFGFLFEPRAQGEEPSVFPFITWPVQDFIFVGLQRYLGRRDMGWKKSRSQGASWKMLYLFLHEFIFSPKPKAFGLVSRTEDAVASDVDPDSLFWKIDFVLARQPSWLIPFWEPKRDKLMKSKTYLNRDTDSTIVGAAAVKNIFRSGRKTAIGWDEVTSFPANFMERAMRSTSRVTNCRICLSTPESDQDEFYTMMHVPSTMLWISQHWSHNPLHSVGLYSTDEDGNLTIHDAWHYRREYPSEFFRACKEVGVSMDSGVVRVPKQYVKKFVELSPYKFIFEPSIGGKLRSAWYDEECAKPGETPQGIAKELDINFAGASYKFFGDLTPLRGKLGRPVAEGDMVFDGADPRTAVARFVPNPGGPWKVWFHIDRKGRPPADRYAVGADVAAGGASDASSNSTCIVLRRSTGRQVLEYASHAIYPRDFAVLVAAVCRWLSLPLGGEQALLNWDCTGTGTQFTRAMREECGYGYLYRRRTDADKRINGQVFTDIVGWNSTDPRGLMDDLSAAIFHDTIVLSDTVLAECTGWEHKKGKVVYVPSLTTKVDSAMGAAHGDRVTGASIAYKAFKILPAYQVEEAPREIPYGSFAWFQKLAEDEANYQDELIFS